MPTLQRTVTVLTFPVIAWLGASCTDMPTEPLSAPVMPLMQYGTADLVVDDDGFATAADCDALTPTYMTISAAVADADPNDIIEVCPGAYNESVTINMPLTVFGPNDGIPWDGVRGAEAVVSSAATTFNVTDGEDVTIDGFMINGDFGIYVSGSTTNTTILNNIITGTSRALSLEPSGSNTSVLDNHLISVTRSMHVSGTGPYSNLKVNGNRFSGTVAGPGIFFLANIPVTGFEFKNNDVFVYANIASDITSGTVSENTFDAPPGFVLDLQILLQNSTMTENVFEGDDVSACLQLFGTQFSPGDPSHDVTISENTFNDCGGAAPFNYAIQLSNDVYNIHIENNDISSGVEGVNTRDIPPAWDVTQNIHINYNNITDNSSFGVRNGQSGILDAECNWWGAANGPGAVGPGSGDNVSTNVDFTPWLVGPAPGGPCVGGVPPPEMVTGGGQINVTGGVGSFGFNAKPGTQSGHLNYLNHVPPRKHLNCTVNSVTVISTTEAELSGTCSDGSTFMAKVADNEEPGKGEDEFEITYNGTTDGATGPIRSGNIQIR